MGYPFGKKGWRCYDLETRQYVISHDVKFMEDQFPFPETLNAKDKFHWEQYISQVPLWDDDLPLHDSDAQDTVVTTYVPTMPELAVVPSSSTDYVPTLLLGHLRLSLLLFLFLFPFLLRLHLLTLSVLPVPQLIWVVVFELRFLLPGFGAM